MKMEYAWKKVNTETVENIKQQATVPFVTFFQYLH